MNDTDLIRVTVTMTRKQHKALKSYGTFFGLTQSQLVTECVTYFINTHYKWCEFTQRLIKDIQLPLDKRAPKPCYGPSCFVCTKQIECRTGKYEGVLLMKESSLHLATDEAKMVTRELQLAHGQEPQWPEDTTCNKS